MRSSASRYAGELQSGCSALRHTPWAPTSSPQSDANTLAGWHGVVLPSRWRCGTFPQPPPCPQETAAPLGSMQCHRALSALDWGSIKTERVCARPPSDFAPTRTTQRPGHRHRPPRAPALPSPTPPSISRHPMPLLVQHRPQGTGFGKRPFNERLPAKAGFTLINTPNQLPATSRMPSMEVCGLSATPAFFLPHGWHRACDASACTPRHAPSTRPPQIRKRLDVTAGIDDHQMHVEGFWACSQWPQSRACRS